MTLPNRYTVKSLQRWTSWTARGGLKCVAFKPFMCQTLKWFICDTKSLDHVWHIMFQTWTIDLVSHSDCNNINHATERFYSCVAPEPQIEPKGPKSAGIKPGNLLKWSKIGPNLAPEPKKGPKGPQLAGIQLKKPKFRQERVQIQTKTPRNRPKRDKIRPKLPRTDPYVWSVDQNLRKSHGWTNICPTLLR